MQQPPDVRSFTAFAGFIQAGEKTATHKMVRLDCLQMAARAWIVHPVSGNASTEAWTSCNGTVWTQQTLGLGGWLIQFIHDNGQVCYLREGYAQLSNYKTPPTLIAHLVKFTGIPMALLALHPSVNPHVVEALGAVSKKTSLLGGDVSSATLFAAAAPAAPAAAPKKARARAGQTPQNTGFTHELRFTSATRLVVEASNQATAEDIAQIFSASQLCGFKELDLSQLRDGCPIATAVVRLKPPFLRGVIVASPPSADALTPLCEALVASPYVEALRIEANRSNELLEALIPYAHRFSDVNTATNVTWLDGPSKVGLHRKVPLVSVAASIAEAKQKPPAQQQPEAHLVIKLLGTRSPPLLRSNLRFSAFLTDLMHQDTRADEIELPSHRRNEEGKQELENRFTDVDVELAVLWLNEYACDAVHEMVTEDPTAYFVSLQGQTFFEEHIHKVDQPRATLRRCLSVLSLAHYLRIATLESLMLSILASRQSQGLFDALAK